MKRARSDWYIPPDWAALLGLYVIILPIGILGALLLPALNDARRGNPAVIYISTVFALTGIVLLFFARLPLYKRHRYFSFGPKALPPSHRKLYWTAYVFIGIAVTLLLLLLMALG